MKRLLTILLAAVATLSATAQLQRPSAAADTAGATMVYLEQCETLSFDEERLPDAQLLKGNVRFRHDNALMYCDSAYYYDSRNSFEAFSNVRIVQGDSIFVYGDHLTYDGNTRMATLRNNVRMENDNATLTTDSLNYDRNANIAYYYTGGTIRDDLNTLTSVWGQYLPDIDEATFRRDVRLVNENFVMTSDTLKYNTKTHLATILGPTEVVYERETTIYSTLGLYNTETEHSTLYRRSRVEHEDGRTLVGDTIYYDKLREYGEVHSHMELTDSTHKTTLYGNFGTFDQRANQGMATDSAMLVDWSSEDTLYVHADTIYTNRMYLDSAGLEVRKAEKRRQLQAQQPAAPADSVAAPAVNDSTALSPLASSLEGDSTALSPDSTALLPLTSDLSPDSTALSPLTSHLSPESPDTIEVDSTYHLLRGFHNVRLYRNDLQGVSDSIAYSSVDSIMHLFGQPIVWNENNQLSGELVDVFVKNDAVDHVVITQSAIVIQELDTLHYNQMAGKEIVAYVIDKEVRRVDVNGNAETIFYPEDENDSSLIGMNKTQSSFIRIYVKDQKIDYAVLTSASNGSIFPVDETSEEDRFLGNYFWAVEERPNKPSDIFNRPKRTERKRQRVSATEQTSDLTSKSAEAKAAGKAAEPRRRGRNKDR